MFGVRSAMHSSALSPPANSLLGDRRTRDAVAGARPARNDQRNLETMPVRKDARRIAQNRPAVSAALALRRQEAQAEHLFADRPPVIAVTKQHSDDQNSHRHRPNDRDPADRPAEPRQKVADDGRWQNQQDGDGQGIDQEGRHAQEGRLGRVHETLCRQYRKTDSGPMNPHSRVIYSLLAVSLAAACVPLEHHTARFENKWPATTIARL